METKDIGLGDILSVTTGKLVSTSGEYPIDGVYNILNFMTGDSLYTHQLPRVCREMAPILLCQHPQLADVDASGVNGENWRAWLDEQIAKFGATLPVTSAESAHQHRDPVAELAEMAPGIPIIAVKA